MPELAIDHEARQESQKASMLAQQAIIAIKSHEDRCLQATRDVNEELIRQREQQQRNHEATITSVAGFHRHLEDMTGTLHGEIDSLKEEDSNLKNSSSQKEVKFYRWVGVGAIGLVISLVSYIWISSGS